jgi:hypothetical protein
MLWSICQGNSGWGMEWEGGIMVILTIEHEAYDEAHVAGATGRQGLLSFAGLRFCWWC